MLLQVVVIVDLKACVCVSMAHNATQQLINNNNKRA